MMKAFSLILVVALAGCALKTPPPHSEVVEQALPEKTSIPAGWKADPNASAVTDNWLESFHDPALDTLVAEAIANNLDLRQAAERVRIAHAMSLRNRDEAASAGKDKFHFPLTSPV